MKQMVCIQFLVPMYTMVNSIIEPVDYNAYREELLTCIHNSGIVDLQSVVETKRIRDMEFEEEFLVLKCSPDIVHGLINQYMQLISSYHNVFRHNFYVYNMDGINYTFFPYL